MKFSIEKILHKIKRYQVKHFADTYNKQDLSKHNKKVMLIDKGMYEYGYFNFTFLDNMLSLIIEALYKGYMPVVQLDGRKDGWTNWDTFFEQPFKKSDENNYETCSLKIGHIAPSFKTPFNQRDLPLWCKIYRDFAVLNDKTQRYVDNEYNSLLKDKRVLGVLCRGTDYVQKQPFGHPIQPTVEDVIALSKEKIKELKLEHIYLATEEKRIVEQFKSVFPNRIIVNKRTYYDEIFYNNNLTDIYQVQFERENDIYLKGLEYLSSIYLLSKCDTLIAGNCGGSTSALYLNDGNYKYWKLFDLGFYGVTDKKNNRKDI